MVIDRKERSQMRALRLIGWTVVGLFVAMVGLALLYALGISHNDPFTFEGRVMAAGDGRWEVEVHKVVTVDKALAKYLQEADCQTLYSHKRSSR